MLKNVFILRTGLFYTFLTPLSKFVYCLVVSLNFSKNFVASLFVTKVSHTKNFLGNLFETFPLIKNCPFLIMLLILFSLNHAIIFCTKICVTVLLNQYSTGLFVSSFRRKIQLHKNCYLYLQILIPLLLKFLLLAHLFTLSYYGH